MAESTAVSTLLALADDPSLIGRDLVVYEAGVIERGPITDISVKSGSYLEITVAWLARNHDPDGQLDGPWELTHNAPFTYGGADGWGYAHAMQDGSIHIGVPLAWSGDILSADTPRLDKP